MHSCATASAALASLLEHVPLLASGLYSLSVLLSFLVFLYSSQEVPLLRAEGPVFGLGSGGKATSECRWLQPLTLAHGVSVLPG